MHDIDLLTRKLQRERDARKQAERLLESKSREIYQTNEELRQLTVALQRHAELTSAIVSNAAEGIITYNEQGRIDSINPAAERIFQFEATELIGQEIQVLQCRTSNPHPRKDDYSAHMEPSELVGRRKSGEAFPMVWSESRVTLDDRRLWVVMVRDLSHRKALEVQLAHAQKMESVGQLAAGIAHEINTPIQYVGDNIRFLQNAFDDLQQLLGQYQQLSAAVLQEGAPASELARKTDALGGQIDLEYLAEEIPLAIQQAIEGTTRVSKIVRAMKEFSHPGVEEKTRIDLNQSIDSTVTVSRNEWKYVAEIERDFDPQLPLIPCYPGEFNQVMLNLIVNAAHAMASVDEESQEELGKITISTRLIDTSVEIRVRDTGGGIPKSIKSKIFDPFFTTKGVGKGTGQGLAIAYSVIVELHGGAIDFETEEGVGTTFIIRLPLDPDGGLPARQTIHETHPSQP